MKKNRKGFTLIELLVVIAIIGLLSTLAIVSLNTARQKSRDTKRMADLRTLQSAIELCINEGGNPPSTTGTALGTVPTTWTGMSAALCSPTTPALGTYLASSTIPVPPTGGGAVACGLAAAWDATVPQNCYSYCHIVGSTDYLLMTSVEVTTSGGSTTNALYAAGTCIDVSATGTSGVSTAAVGLNACGTLAHNFCLGK